MQLSQYARQQGSRYRTALRWGRASTIMGYPAPTGTLLVTTGETLPAAQPEKFAIDARVCALEHRDNLQRQATRCADSCTVRGTRWHRWSTQSPPACMLAGAHTPLVSWLHERRVGTG
jgi:hypothetical protein